MAALDWTGQGSDAAAWEVVNIGGGGRVRLDRLIALIAAVLWWPARLDRLPHQPGDVRLTAAAGLEHAGRVLGYRPRVGIEQGIRRFVRWYDEETHGR